MLISRIVDKKIPLTINHTKNQYSYSFLTISNINSLTLVVMGIKRQLERDTFSIGSINLEIRGKMKEYRSWTSWVLFCMTYENKVINRIVRMISSRPSSTGTKTHEHHYLAFQQHFHLNHPPRRRYYYLSYTCLRRHPLRKTMKPKHHNWDDKHTSSIFPWDDCDI